MERQLLKSIGMKSLKRLMFLGFLVASFTGKTQNPDSYITPQGNMSVCSGSTVNVSATVTNPFASTTGYGVTNIPFAPHPVGGIPVNLIDDQVAGPLPIGFVFCFFGNQYSQFYLSSNGWIGFSPGQTLAFTAATVPSASPLVPKNCIMGPWMDFNPGVGSGVGTYIRYQTQGIAPYRRLVVSFTNCPLYACVTTFSTFQIVIYESTNIIEHHITNKPVCMGWAGGTATQALHNNTGTVAVAVPGRNASVWTATNDAKRFTPNGPPVFTTNWTANGIPQGSGASINYTVTTPAQIIATTTFNCSNLILRDTLNLTLGGTTNASFTGPATICAGQPATYTYVGGATTGATFNWTFPGGTPASSTSAGPVNVTYATPGNYTASLTVNSASCGPGTSTQNINVTNGPASTFSLPASACVGSNVNISYTGTPIAGATYNWNFGPNATVISGSGAGPYVVSFGANGNQNVSLSVSSGGCTSTTSNSINITTGVTSTFNLPASLCIGQNGTITYTGNATAGATYAWNFGAGASPATATGQGPHSVSWSTAGSKTISLTVTQGGCNSTTSLNLTVNTAPSSAFTATSPVCTGSPTTLTYTGGAAGATFNWTLPTGSLPATVSGAGPHSVTLPTGSQTVGLTVTAGGCTSTLTNQTVVVNALPTSTIVTTPASVCIGQNSTISLSPTVTGATYIWNFGAGATVVSGSGAGPYTINWNSAGSKTISVQITANGCTNTISNTINVTNGITSAFTLPTTGCTGQSFSLLYSGNAGGGAAYTWTVTGSGSSSASFTGPGPHSISWNASGTKTISLAVSQGGCSAPLVSQTIQISDPPTSTFTVSSATTCINQNVTATYTGNAPAGATYTWNFNGGTIVSGSGQGPYQINWATTGIKTITLSVTQNGCTSVVSSQTVDVKAAPTSTFSFTPNPVCQGVASTFSYTGNATVGATYSWNFGSGASPATSTTAGPHAVSYATSGSKTITLQVSQFGCSSTVTTQTLIVNPLPTASFTMPASVCQNASANITFNGTPAPPAGSTYNWNFGGGTIVSGSGAGPYSVNWSTSGAKTVTVQVTSPAGCVSTLASNSIQVTPSPTSSFTIPSTACNGTPVSVVYTGTASSSATYTWGFDGGTIVSGSGQGPYNVSWSTNGNKNITLTVTENGCTSTISSQVIAIQNTPTALFTVNPSTVCQGSAATITFTGSAPAGSTYNWNFGASATVISGSGAGPYQVSWNSTGTLPIFLSVANGTCVSPSATQFVTVSPGQFPAFTLPSSACIGNTVTINYTGTTSAGNTYSWNFGGATVISGSGVGPYQVQWPTSGAKTVSVQVPNGACTSAPVTQTIQIAAPPTASIVMPSSACAGSPVTVQYSGNAGAGATFNWNFGGGQVISGSGPGPYQINWPGAGSQMVTLTVSENGCTSSVASSTIQINQINPFTLSADAVVAVNSPSVIQFNGTLASGSTISWNFGSGTVISGSGSGPYQVSWSSSGSQSVTATVNSNGCATLTQSVQVQVVAGATASFTTSSSACVQSVATVTFNGAALPTASFSWDFGGAQIISGSGEGPYQILFNTAGTYTVGLTITQNGITTPAYTQTIQVFPIPTATFSVPSVNCSLSPIALQYTGNAGTGATYSWTANGANFVSGTSASQNPSISYTLAGNYSIGLQVSENGCSSTVATQNIVLNQTPEPLMEIDSVVCQNDQVFVIYVGSGSMNANYQWGFDNAQILFGNADGPYLLQWTTSGSKTLWVQVSENGCVSDTGFFNVEVKPLPTANFNLPASVCEGDNISFSYNGNAASTAQFNWNSSPGTNFSGNGPGPYSLTYPSSGLYYVSLSVDWDGCISSPVQQNVDVTAVPTASFTLPDTVYVGQSAAVVYTGSGSGSSSFVWDFDNATIQSGSAQGPYQVSWAQEGNYQVSLNVMTGTCSSIPVVNTIVVLPLPPSAFSMQSQACSGDTVFVEYIGNAPANAQFNWNFGNAQILSGSGAGPYYLSFATSGVQLVSLTLTVNGQETPQHTNQIAIHSIPTAVLTLPSAACIGAAVDAQLQTSAGAGAQFVWNYTGNPTVNGSGAGPVQFIWNSAQTEQVSVTVSENGCSTESSLQNITLYNQPSAQFDLPANTCEGSEFEVTYSGTVVPNQSYNWNWGSLNVLSGSGVGPYVVSATSNQTNFVSLVVNANGCSSAVFTDSIEIISAPVVNAGPDRTLCATDTITINATVSGNATVQWSPSMGILNPNEAEAQLSLTTPHNYAENRTYVLTATIGGCSVSDTLQVNLVPKPVAGFSTPGLQCRQGNSFDFVAGGFFMNNALFSWNFGPHANQHFQNARNPQDVSFFTAGFQPVTLSVTQLGCVSEPYTDSVFVAENPSAEFRTNFIKGCAPLTAFFEDLSFNIDSTALSYNWNFGNGFSSNQRHAQHTYIQPGEYTVTLVVTNQAGCTDTVSKPNLIRVYDKPDVSFKIYPQTAFIGQEVQLTSLSDIAGNCMYNMGDGGSVITCEGFYSYSTEGTFPITLVATSQYGCKDSLTKFINVEIGPDIYIPTAFTPNGDGLNDEFKIYGDGIRSMNLQVYDRWGGLIWQGNDPNEGWDGFTPGGIKSLRTDTYTYKLIYTTKDGIERITHGRIALVD